jgi:hypothetical protein
MGNNNTNSNTNDTINEYNACLVCWKRIQKPSLVSCSKCNIQMHDFCYQNYNKIKNYNYCVCPHCQRVGTFEPGIWFRQSIFENKHRYISKN